MSQTHFPEYWIPVRVRYGQEVRYAVLATWRGGASAGDEWKLSSGITAISTTPEGYFVLTQRSGAVYVCTPIPREDAYLWSQFRRLQKLVRSDGGSLRRSTLARILRLYQSGQGKE
jgi:hypothetical protein